LCAVLHELGHIQDKNIYLVEVFLGAIMNREEVWENELHAWGYVFRCVRQEWYGEVLEVAAESLMSYVSACDIELSIWEVKELLLDRIGREGLFTSREGQTLNLERKEGREYE
jgi:hypothetical protein